MAASVGDDQCRLRGEHHQGFFVLLVIFLALFTLGEEDVAHHLTLMEDGSGQQRRYVYRREELRQPHGHGMAGEVRYPQRFGEVAQVFKDPEPLRYIPQLPGLLGSKTGGQKVYQSARVLETGDDAVAGVGEGPGAVQDALEHGFELQGFVDAAERLAQLEEAAPQVGVLEGQLVGLVRHLFGPRSVRRRFG